MKRKAKILIVDDYPENITALSSLIESDQVEIHSAANADQALELLIHHDFGLALLDVQMPIVNGFELARLIRGVKRFRHLPIIFVTAHQEDRNVIFQGYETGAVDLMFKPLDPHIVRSKVGVFVELQKQKDLLQDQVREMDRLRFEAEAANIAKSQFLANMSHEIRTPLAAVLGFTDLVTRGQIPEEQKDECVAAIRRNGNLLLRLIDDILDLSKIEANRLELEKVDFDLNEVFRDIESTLSFKAKEKGIQLRIQNRTDGSPHCLSDPIRIKQVLLNVIGNAIKFSSDGVVEVTIDRSNSGKLNGDSDILRVRVKDQGIGITPEQASRLFQPFAQADASTRRNFGGSGLGLVISRQIARALGGDLHLVSSTPGQGCTFEVTFQLERSSGRDTRPTPVVTTVESRMADLSLDLSRFRILAVDDSPDNLTLIQMFLRSTKVRLTLAENGIKAVQEVRNSSFDLILMDVQMPGMDGLEATEEIRKQGFRGPIVALTAHAIRSEHDKCRRAGCDEVIVKPINRHILMQNLQRFLNPPTSDVMRSALAP